MEYALEGPATKRQLWALFCATKKDYRNSNLTKKEASDLLAKTNETKPKVLDKSAVDIMSEALEAGSNALKVCVPTPMIVSQHTNMLDDNSPVEKSWFVPSGACGFAWVHVPYNTPKNRAFINGLKKVGLVGEHKSWSKAYNGGYQYWVSVGGQSVELKEAYAHAMANVLSSYDIKAYSQSRLD